MNYLFINLLSEILNLCKIKINLLKLKNFNSKLGLDTLLFKM